MTATSTAINGAEYLSDPLDEVVENITAGADIDSGRHCLKQADILIALAASADLFRSPDGTGFADLDINGHRETWPIRSKGFRRWLARGRQLRAARTLAGLTQSELSTKAGFNPRACRYWESRGDKPPTNVDGTLEAIETTLLRYGVEVFAIPSLGCRLVSTK